MLSDKDRKGLNRLTKQWKVNELEKQLCNADVSPVYFNAKLYNDKAKKDYTKMGKRKVYTYCHDKELGFFIGQNRYNIAGNRDLTDNHMPVKKIQGKWVFG